MRVRGLVWAEVGRWAFGRRQGGVWAQGPTLIPLIAALEPQSEHPIARAVVSSNDLPKTKGFRAAPVGQWSDLAGSGCGCGGGGLERRRNAEDEVKKSGAGSGC